LDSPKLCRICDAKFRHDRRNDTGMGDKALFDAIDLLLIRAGLPGKHRLRPAQRQASGSDQLTVNIRDKRYDISAAGPRSLGMPVHVRSIGVME
jgi:hypothetical protein